MCYSAQVLPRILLKEPAAWIYAAVVGTYTLGLTLFARVENEETKSKGQAVGGLVTLGSMILLAGMPFVLPGFWHNTSQVAAWYGCLGIFNLIVARKLFMTLSKPCPAAFRKYVTVLLLGFVVLDSLAAVAAAGWIAGAIVFTLVLPSRVNCAVGSYDLGITQTAYDKCFRIGINDATWV